MVVPEYLEKNKMTYDDFSKAGGSLPQLSPLWNSLQVADSTTARIDAERTERKAVCFVKQRFCKGHCRDSV